MQVPFWHVSVCVHALLSLHAVPLATGVCAHWKLVVASQKSVVHGFPSSHDAGHC